MHTIMNSSFLHFYNRKNHYEDMVKFASLGSWVLNALGGEIDDIESLIGEYPSLEEKVERSLNDNDIELIEFAEKNGLQYTITSNGIKLG